MFCLNILPVLMVSGVCNIVYICIQVCHKLEIVSMEVGPSKVSSVDTLDKMSILAVPSRKLVNGKGRGKC